MKKISVAAVFFILCLILPGCVIITIPGGVQPPVEKVLGGKGADKVLVVDISGLITGGERTNVLGAQTEPNVIARIKEELSLAAKDDHVKAVVLRINSPGGSVTTCDIINHELKAFKKEKKLVVISELMDVAASGGYYIAAASDGIVANPTSVTGSIGVIAYNISAAGLMDKIGITNQTIKSGDKKDIGSPLRNMTAEERNILQSVIDGMYERFLDVVMEGRPGAFTREELRKIADGRIYNADQALKLRLIDRIGYMEDAVTLAKEKAGIKEARIVTYSQSRAYKNNIYSGLLSNAPETVNLINIDAGQLSGRFGLAFMYLWTP
jgi:protease IV